MTRTHNRPGIVLAAVIAISAFLPGTSDATVVRVETSLGTFDVNLYDNATPVTVTNFLGYVDRLDYTNSIFHRSPPGFVLQGGGFNYNLALPLNTIPAISAIVNEPVFSNIRGTIAMAKTNTPNSATNQWFINLNDNIANLDLQNAGFTVFGEVVGTGMAIVDSISALPTYDFSTRFLSAAFVQLPLRDYTITDFNSNVPINGTHLVMISSISVFDPTIDSAAGLNPTLNTLINQPPPPPPATSGGGGGSFGLIMLFGLLLVTRLKAIRPNIQ